MKTAKDFVPVVIIAYFIYMIIMAVLVMKGKVSGKTLIISGIVVLPLLLLGIFMFT